MSTQTAEPVEREPLLGEALTLPEVARVLRLHPDVAERLLSRTETRAIRGWDRVGVLRLAERLDAQPDLRRVLLR